jgi:hypothetical protein
MLAKTTLNHISQQHAVKSKVNVTGGMRIYPRTFDGDNLSGCEILLKHAFGSVTSAGGGPYVHTFALARALPTGLSFTVNRDSASIGGTSCFR